MSEQIDIVVRDVRALELGHPVRVGIDGFCGAGKSTVAEGIATALAAVGVPLIRVSTDNFQNPPEIRWQLGTESPEGFYRHAVDLDALKKEVLAPLERDGSMRYRTSIYDIHALRPNVSAQFIASPDSVLIVDGLFLHSAEIRGFFDYSVFVEASTEVCIKRAIERNQEGKETEQEIESLYRQRYVPGFTMYVSEAHPREVASTTVINE